MWARHRCSQCIVRAARRAASSGDVAAAGRRAPFGGVASAAGRAPFGGVDSSAAALAAARADLAAAREENGRLLDLVSKVTHRPLTSSRPCSFCPFNLVGRVWAGCLKVGRV